jgi:hypothetical protein
VLYKDAIKVRVETSGSVLSLIGIETDLEKELLLALITVVECCCIHLMAVRYIGKLINWLTSANILKLSTFNQICFNSLVTSGSACGAPTLTF